jgi:hypothetical protein
MIMSVQNIFSRSSNIAIYWSIAIAVVFSSVQRVTAAEEIIFSSGAATQSVAIEELEEFAATGKIAPSLKFLFKVSDRDPKTMRQLLTQSFPADTALVAKLLNSESGEYVLSQTSRVIGTKSDRANIQALRGALITSVSNDRQASLLEILQNYPTQKVYVDGRMLGSAAKNINSLISEAEKYIEMPLTLVQDFLNSL